VQLGIKQAVCAPVMTEESVSAFLYLDARSEGARTEPDAPAFCGALAQLAGIALGNLARRDIEDRHAALQAELSEAHGVQRTLMPGERGRAGRWQYAVRMVPGRTVAGDLFDIVQLPDGRVAFVLGDVAGKGAAAGVVMTAVIAQLHASLAADPDPGHAARTLNRYLVSRTHGRFVSLWLGVAEPEGGAVRFVDAGHGHGLIVRATGGPEPLPRPNAMVLGAADEAPFTASSMTLPPGDRIVLFSDGVVEQRSPEGELFGTERAASALQRSRSHAEDVEALHRAVCAWAERESLTDDLTAASFGYA
jgi:serine phosphatase RsbU (regulator of sigma subunit)